MAIALANAGAEVSAVCPTSNHPLLKTRAVTRSLPYKAIRPLEALLEAIRLTQPQLIVPCDDLVVYHLHQLHAQTVGDPSSGVADLVERSLGNASHYATVSSRSHLLKIAQEEQIPTPATKEIRALNDLSEWLAIHSSPCVLKMDRTWGGRGVRVAPTPDRAEKLFHEMTGLFGDLRALKELVVNGDSIWIRPPWNRSRPAMTVQQYINGRPANCAVVGWKGRLLAGIAVEAVETQGETGPATVVRVVNNPEMMLSAERLAKRLGLSGFLGLDFVIEAGSNVPYLIEMNPRCTPLCHLRLGSGRDMVAALCEQISERTFPEEPPVTENGLIAYFPQAWFGKSEYLATSYHDIPQGEPELVQMLLDFNYGRKPSSRFWNRRSMHLCKAGYAAAAPLTPGTKTN